MNFWNRYLFIFRCKCIFHHVALIKKTQLPWRLSCLIIHGFFLQKKQMITCSAWICTLKFLIMIMHILGIFLPMAILGASCLSISEICPSYTLFVLTHPYNELVLIDFWENLPPAYTFKVQLLFCFCFVLTLLNIWFQKTFQILYLLTISELH